MKGTVKDRLFVSVCLLATVVSVGLVFLLLGGIVYEGWTRIGLDIIRNPHSEDAIRAGVQVALVGSLWLIALTTLISVPIGIGTAIYLEEYARESWIKSLIQLNISNLAAVPSVVYGIIGLGLFVRTFALDRSILSGALTLSLVILPQIIMSAQEALRSVPASIRNASYALGATRWQTVWRQVLPVATPSMMTGVILSVSRALGEAAPILLVGAFGAMTFLPSSVFDEFSALPVQIFDWSRRPMTSQELADGTGFRVAAGAAITVLMTVLISLNAIAVYLRYRFTKHDVSR